MIVSRKTIGLLTDWLNFSRWKDHRGGVTGLRGPTEDLVFPLRSSTHDWSNFKNPAGLWTSKRQNSFWEMVVETPPTYLRLYTLKPLEFLICVDLFLVRGPYSWRGEEAFHCGCECSAGWGQPSDLCCCRMCLIHELLGQLIFEPAKIAFKFSRRNQTD